MPVIPVLESWTQVNPRGLLVNQFSQISEHQTWFSNTKMGSKRRRHPVLTSGLHMHMKPAPMHIYTNTIHIHHIYMYVYTYVHKLNYVILKDRLNFVR